VTEKLAQVIGDSASRPRVERISHARRLLRLDPANEQCQALLNSLLGVRVQKTPETPKVQKAPGASKTTKTTKTTKTSKALRTSKTTKTSKVPAPPETKNEVIAKTSAE